MLPPKVPTSIESTQPFPHRPSPVTRFIDAINRGDLDELLATFATDALVNDQFCDYWGRAAIAEWAARDLIGEQLTMQVVGVVERLEHALVKAHVDGNFDKRGLPEPLVLAFYFCTHGEEITQLIILRNYAGI